MKDKDGFDIGIYGIRVEQGFIEGAFAWALKDPDKWYGCEKKGWTGLYNLYKNCYIDKDRTIPLEIPDLPPGYGGRWIKCVFSIWKWYRIKLSEIRTPTDDDRWESFIISYCAIRKLAETNQHQEMSLVYKACKMDHLNNLKKIRKECYESLPSSAAVPEINLDIKLDVEQALSKLPEKQYIIARLRLMENMDWESIAEEVDMSERQVRRLYNDAESSLKESLKHYE